MRNVEATYDITGGVDHRSVVMEFHLHIQTESRKKTTPIKRATNLREWRPANSAEYKNALESSADTFKEEARKLSMNLEDGCKKQRGFIH